MLHGVRHSPYLKRYLSFLGCSTIVEEELYIEKGYLIDYTLFHARAFHPPDRFTRRLHFFKDRFNSRDLTAILESGDPKRIDSLKESYLGYTVVRPVVDAYHNFLLGHTILKTYPDKENSDTRVFITTPCTASMFGILLTMPSLPYQTQDIGVGACATAALWMTNNALHHLFGCSLLSLAEVTRISTETQMGMSRVFPSDGLDIYQMLSFIRSIGLDAELPWPIDPTRLGSFFEVVIRAYVPAGIPVLAVLELTKSKGPPDYHAVAISGYRLSKNGVLTELYVHDDGIGPYSKAIPVKGNVAVWKNEWTSKSRRIRYKSLSIVRLIVPIYPKVRLSFGRIYSRYQDYLRGSIRERNVRVELFLTQVNDYKKSLSDKRFADKSTILSTLMPRFLWVIRLRVAQELDSDHVYDATAVYPNMIANIHYERF